MSRTLKKLRRRAKREAPMTSRREGVARTARMLGAGGIVIMSDGPFGEVLAIPRRVELIDWYEEDSNGS
jgi:hypothetical protein